MWEFNYGEWTEAYVFLRLLGNGRIYGADSNFQRDENVYLDIINILRHEKDHILKFERMIEEAKVKASDNGVAFRVLAYAELLEKADFLYDAIKNITTSEGKFPVPEIEGYLSDLRFSQPKVPQLPKDVAEQYGSKTDIIITLEDSIDHSVSTMGFSVKSHLGQASTLFNCSKSSNLKFKITGCDDAIMDQINGEQIGSEIGLFSYIKNHADLDLDFQCTSDQFTDNLDLIDGRMPELFANLMLVQLSYLDSASSRKTADLVSKLAELDPLKVRRPEVWYETNMKKFLFASFAGLTAAKPWDGRRRLSGGYIDVNKDGEMLYYRAVSDDIFESYLYEHTFIDRPSRGVNKDVAKVKAIAHLESREATEEEIHDTMYKPNGKKKDPKGDWGYVFKENGEYFININFQVRFI